MGPSPPQATRGSTYIACELMHGAILGHVVFLVRIILWKKQSQLPEPASKALCSTPGPRQSAPDATSWKRGVGVPLRHTGERWDRKNGAAASPLRGSGAPWVLTSSTASLPRALWVAWFPQEPLRQAPGGPAHSSRAADGEGEHLDVVGKVLQCLGSNCLHGGDEAGQLVLGAGSCTLRTHMAAELSLAPLQLPPCPSLQGSPSCSATL